MTIHHAHAPPEVTFLTRNHGVFKALDPVGYDSTRTLDNPTAQGTLHFRGLTWGNVSDKRLRGRSILDTLGLYDLCRVRLRDRAGNLHTDVLGLVGDITEHESGSPDDSVEVPLLGLGEAIRAYQIFWHPHIAGQNNLGGIGFLARAGGKVPGGRPDQVIRQLLEAFLNDKYLFTLADGRKLSELFRLRFEEIRDSLAVLGLSALGAEGPLWDTLKRYSDAPWNELFVDLERSPQSTEPTDTLGRLGQATARAFDAGRGGFEKINLHLRPTPFDFDRWGKLASVGSGWSFDLDADDLMEGGSRLTKSTNGLANFFWCPYKGILSGFDQLSAVYETSNREIPIFDEDSIRRYGLRRLEQATEYAQYLTPEHVKGAPNTIAEQRMMKTKYPRRVDLLIRRTYQLYQWFGYPEGFLSGTIMTRPRIGPDPIHGGRIGGVLKRKRDGKEFYITGIRQSWSHPGPWVTTFQVSRGHDPKAYRKWWTEILSRPRVVPPTILQDINVGVG